MKRASEVSASVIGQLNSLVSLAQQLDDELKMGRHVEIGPLIGPIGCIPIGPMFFMLQIKHGNQRQSQ